MAKPGDTLYVRIRHAAIAHRRRLWRHRVISWVMIATVFVAALFALLGGL